MTKIKYFFQGEYPPGNVHGKFTELKKIEGVKNDKEAKAYAESWLKENNTVGYYSFLCAKIRSVRVFKIIHEINSRYIQ